MSILNISVLLVEDDRLSLMVYSEFIKKMVSDVYTASDGLEGISVYRKQKPDIIITDIRMPGLDGLEMIRKIKAENPYVKVIMISGHSEVEYLIQSIDLGVDAYLLKPVDNKKLEEKVEELGKNILLSKKVAETEKKFRDFAALLPQIVFEADLNGKLTFVNELALKKFRYSKKELANGLYLQDMLAEKHQKKASNIQSVIKGSRAFQEQEVTCKTRKGELFPALIYTSGIMEDGKLAGVRGVMVDITSRKRMMEELQSLNLELEEKVAQRTRRLSNEIKEKEIAEKELIKAKEKAEESDQMKGVFLGNVSHEIQTPIKAIISFSKLLQSPGLDDTRRSELISIIESNSNALLNLTNDILEFTRLQSKTVKLFLIMFDLNLFLKELFPVFETLKRKQADKDIELKLDIPDENQVLMIKSDPSRLRQIFTNLISNAFKFTHEGYVKYGYRLGKGNTIRFFVEDTGLGISKTYQKKIFERFIQEPKPLNVKKEGTGLGLPITQSLISKLKGRIWVESGLGNGSTFYFEFPGILIGEEDHGQDNEMSWEDCQMLIIEDEIKEYIRLEEMLKNRIQLHYLNNIEQAVEYCSSNKKIDICFYRMKKKTDLNLIDNIRLYSPGIKVVALLDKKSEGAEKKRLKNRFDNVISKPFRKDKIMRVLKSHLG